MIFGVGVSFALTAFGVPMPKDKTIIHATLDPMDLNKDVPAQHGLIGDAKLTLAALNTAMLGFDKAPAATRADEPEKITALREAWMSEWLPKLTNNEAPINPYRVAWELNEFLTEETIYIGDGGDVVTISAQAVRPRSPGHWMDPGPLGSLGVGTGFAIAAKLAHPEKEVLCYYGDGSFGMTAFDMETANRFGLPYIAVIGNNSAQNQIRCGQIAKYGEERGNIGNKLGDVDFEHFATMLGGYGEAVRDPSEIGPALLRAREAVKTTGKSAVVNIWVDPNEYAPGTKRQTMYK